MSRSAGIETKAGVASPHGARARVAAVSSPRALVRRHLAHMLVVAALGFGAGTALAQPFFAGRMSPDERDRLRRELRQQPDPGRRADDPASRRERMSPRERDQLRQQLRDARRDDGRRDDGRGRGRRFD